MTDHLDEAAAKAVDLAEDLLGPRSDLTTYMAAAHLAYMAGLLRGGAVIEAAHRAFPLRVVEGVDPLALPDEELRQLIVGLRTQRDALLAAAKGLLERDNGTTRSGLHSIVARIEAE